MSARLGLAALFLAGVAGAPVSAEPWLLDDPALRPIPPGSLAERPPVFPFGAGEELHYAVSAFGIPVGRAVFEVARLVEKDGVRMAHLALRAATSETMSRLYRVDDRLEAWIDLDTLGTLRTRTVLHHGRRVIHEDLALDWSTHYLTLHREERHRGKIRDVAFDFGPSLQDLLPAFYALRAFPLEAGAERSFAVYASKKIYGFHLAVEEAEPVSSPVFGPTRAFVLRPWVSLDATPFPGGRGHVWVREGADAVPLRLRGWVRTKDGFVIARLALELVRYVPPARAHRWATPVLPPAPETVAGRPVWDPPPAVLAAREARGVRPRDEKRTVAVE